MKIVLYLIFGSIALWGFSAYGNDEGCRERCGHCTQFIGNRAARDSCFQRQAQCQRACNQADEEMRRSNSRNSRRPGRGRGGAHRNTASGARGSGSSQTPVITIEEQ